MQPRNQAWPFLLMGLFLLMLWLIPDSSPWFALVFLIPIAGALLIVATMMEARWRRRRAVRRLAGQPPLRALSGRERDALLWFGAPERLVWRIARSSQPVDLAKAVRLAGKTPVVHRIEGPWRITAWKENHDRRHYIGDLLVLPLPGADHFIATHNRAEVLLCDGVAVLLSLNGRWSVRDARGLLR